MVTKKDAALALLPRLNLKANFFTLDSSTVCELVEVAKAVGYRQPRNANGSTARYFFAYLQREPKTQVEYVVQGYYAHGWEDLTADPDYRRARANLKDYRDNAPEPVRLIKRRVPT